MGRLINIIKDHGIRNILWVVLWRDELKYITVGWIALAVLITLCYHFASPVVGFSVAIVSALGFMYGVHTHWVYEQMRDDEEFEHNPIIGAVVGTAIMYAVFLIGVAALFFVWGVISSVTGYPLVLPGVIGTCLVYAVYRWWR